MIQINEEKMEQSINDCWDDWHANWNNKAESLLCLTPL